MTEPAPSYGAKDDPVAVPETPAPTAGELLLRAHELLSAGPGSMPISAGAHAAIAAAHLMHRGILALERIAVITERADARQARYQEAVLEQTREQTRQQQEQLANQRLALKAHLGGPRPT